jgi:hypothetical protein
VLDDQLPRVSQVDAAAAPDYEGQADFLLEQRDLARDCRLGISERPGRAGERTVIRNLAQRVDEAQIEHALILEQVKEIELARI